MKNKLYFMREMILLVVFLFVIISFSKFILENSKIILISLLFFIFNYLIIIKHERKYGKNNFPYKPYKSKEKILNRILTGLFAGIHYIFSIGTYDHKKYNTQVWYPETVECFFGNVSQLIILIGYIFIATLLFKINLYFSIFFLIIPIITNIISLRNKK